MKTTIGAFQMDEDDVKRKQRDFRDLVVPIGLWNKCLGLFEGDRELACRWLISPSLGFGGQRPIDVAQIEPGKVADLISRLEHGIFS